MDKLLMLDDVDAAITRILRGTAAKECETASLDFKEDVGSRSDLERSLVKACVCFANAAGGAIVVGVADRPGGRDAFKGTQIEPHDLRQRISENTQPRLLVDVEVKVFPARILIIRVRQSAAVHADKQGRSWQRINRDCVPLTPEDQARLVDDRRGYDWSAEKSGRMIDEIEPATLSSARQLLNNLTDERRQLANATTPDLLSALGVLVARDYLTKAGELLFCSGLQGSSNAILYQYRSTPGGEPRTVQRPEFPLLTAYARVRELIFARQNTTPVTLPNGQQITIEDFPDLAVREAISNAICHRDWRTTGIINVDHSPEILSITSPGPLVSGVTPDNILTTNSTPRNPALAKAARMLGIAEETGRGIDRMYRETIRSGKALPDIEGAYDRVRVSFRGGAPDTNIARFIAQLPREEQDDTDTMLLLFHFCRARTVTAQQASTLLQKPPEEVSVILRRLSAEHVALLEPTRESSARRRPTYRLRSETLCGLGAAVLYHRRTIDDTDRKVLAHVREYGKITNRTLQNFLDVSMLQARDILGDLAHRGILARVSSSTRGPKVEWGPGPKFPTARPSKKPLEMQDMLHEQAELPLARPKSSRRKNNTPS